MPTPWRLTLGLLSLSQALSQSISVFIMTLAGLVGALLSPDPALATLPIAAVVLGTLLGLIPFSRWMAVQGRRSGFRWGIFLGLLGGVLALAGLALQSFWVFTAGHVLIGLQQGSFQYLRFAASEMMPPEHRSRGISLVLAGGVVAAFLGPWMAFLARSGGLDAEVGLAYAPVVVLFLILQGVFARVPVLTSSSPGMVNSEAAVPPRPLAALMFQPAYLQALVGSAVGYATMILLMTATPLAMAHSGHGSSETSWIIQWHVLGMFVPSFFTGHLIDRWGHRPLLALGLLALFLDAVAAIVFQGLWSYWVSLTLLGIGWNFLYIASTSRLTQTYRPAEKEKAQAAHDLAVFAVNTVATYTAASLLGQLGWAGLHWWSLPLLAVTSVVILFPLKSNPRSLP